MMKRILCILLVLLLPLGSACASAESLSAVDILSQMDDQSLLQLAEAAIAELTRRGTASDAAYPETLPADSAAVLPGGGSAESLPRKTEGDGWATPEEAMGAYLAGLTAGDFDQMLSAFAIETYAGSYDLRAQLERIQVYFYAVEIKLPDIPGLIASANVESRRGQVAGSVVNQLMTLSYPGFEFSMATLMSEYEGGTDAFMAFLTEGAAFDPASIAIGEFVSPASLSEVYLIERNQENMKKQLLVSGADDIQSVAVLLVARFQPYLLCADALRYGDKWYLGSFGGNIGSILGVEPLAGGLIANPME